MINSLFVGMTQRCPCFIWEHSYLIALWVGSLCKDFLVNTFVLNVIVGSFVNILFIFLKTAQEWLLDFL